MHASYRGLLPGVGFVSSILRMGILYFSDARPKTAPIWRDRAACAVEAVLCGAGIGCLRLEIFTRIVTVSNIALLISGNNSR
jgi:hypothetical protein